MSGLHLSTGLTPGRAHKGEFVLGMDDTDLGRSQEEYAQAIIEDMAWLGLDYDHFFKQSDPSA